MVQGKLPSASAGGIKGVCSNGYSVAMVTVYLRKAEVLINKEKNYGRNGFLLKHNKCLKLYIAKGLNA